MQLCARFTSLAEVCVGRGLTFTLATTPSIGATDPWGRRPVVAWRPKRLSGTDPSRRRERGRGRGRRIQPGRPRSGRGEGGALDV